MKKSVFIILLLLSRLWLQAQEPVEAGTAFLLALTTTKTTTLVFPGAVRHVDRGTAAVLVQALPEAENILLVKAGREAFAETSLTVFTRDGKLYVFTVVYQRQPAQLVYHLTEEYAAEGKGRENRVAPTTALLQQSLQLAARQPQIMGGLTKAKTKMKAQVTGIFIQEDVLFFPLRLHNRSFLDYEVDFLRCFVRDNRKGRRSSAQQRELPLLQVWGATPTVEGKKEKYLVLALERVTLPSNQHLFIELGEKNGARNLLLKIPGRKLVRAKPLSPATTSVAP